MAWRPVELSSLAGWDGLHRLFSGPQGSPKLRFVSDWGEAAVLVDGDLRREVFFLNSQGDAIFATMYRAVEPTRPGLLVCPSWGFEMAQTLRLCHGLAHSVALQGGTGMVLHWPGHGDSDGDLQDADIRRLVAAASDGLVAGRVRSGVNRWGLAGVRLGAAAAWTVAQDHGIDMLVLLQPALNPAEFLRDLQARARRAGLDRGRGRWVYGEPLPHPDSWPDTPMARSDERHPGTGVCIRYADDPALGSPRGMDELVVRGSWNRGLRSGYRSLLQPASSWVQSAFDVDA